MVEKKDWLLELGTEELPPRALHTLSEALLDQIRRGLQAAGLGFEAALEMCTPRRLAVLVGGLDVTQPDKIVERRGPALRVAFDGDGKPTRAAEGFARSCGVAANALETVETDKGAWLVFRSQQAGQPAANLLPEIVEKALAALPIPKRMRWGNRDVEFVRPVHWVLMLFGSDVVECRILGVQAGRLSRGHRFHHPEPIEISRPDEYRERLRQQGRVLVDFEERRRLIRALVEEAGRELKGHVVIDEALLDEVTALVEWPVAVTGSFDARFLEVPSEAIISAMKSHQKYFSVVDANGALLPNFVTISNIESRDPSAVRQGNERVIRPRLADAAFFWEQDSREPLGTRIDSLHQVVFQERLGSLHDKAERVAALAEKFALGIGSDTAKAHRAALLAKCDLLTEMVGEFPELQGVMGRHYAMRDTEAEEVAVALEEQYLPRFAGDSLPKTPTGQALSVGDKLDTLMGIFGIGQRPSGDRDPFGLRRAAIGVLRILVETERNLDLEELLRSAADALGGRLQDSDTAPAVFDFMMERFRGYYLEKGFRHDVLEAVIAVRPTRPLDFDRRVRAVTEFVKLPAAESLAEANKRIRNILRKSDAVNNRSVETSRLTESAELNLHRRLTDLSDEVRPLLRSAEYGSALGRLAELHHPVTAFFDEVMVMTDDVALRNNRLSLLAALSELFLQVADVPPASEHENRVSPAIEFLSQMTHSNTYDAMLASVQAFHDKHRFKEEGGEELIYRVALMAEELGEISACATKGKDRPQLAEECADLLILLLGTAIAERFDLEQAFWTKIDKLMQRKSRIIDGRIRVSEFRNES